MLKIMKKLKKLLFCFSGVAVASMLTLAFTINSNDKIKNNNNFHLNQKNISNVNNEISNSGYELDNFSFYLKNQNNENIDNLFSTTADSFKSFPNGYISVGNNGRQVIAYSYNSPQLL